MEKVKSRSVNLKTPVQSGTEDLGFEQLNTVGICEGNKEGEVQMSVHPNKQQWTLKSGYPPPYLFFHKDDLSNVIQMLKGFEMELNGGDKILRKVKPISEAVRVRVEISAKKHLKAKKRAGEDRNAVHKCKSATFYDTTPDKLLKFLLNKLPKKKVALMGRDENGKGKQNLNKPFHYTRVSVYQIHGKKTDEKNSKRSGYISTTVYWDATKVTERLLGGLIDEDKKTYQ